MFPIAVLPVMTMILALRIWLTLATMFVVGVRFLHTLRVVSVESLRKGEFGLSRVLTCLCGSSPLCLMRPVCVPLLLLVVVPVNLWLRLLIVVCSVVVPVVKLGEFGLTLECRTGTVLAALWERLKRRVGWCILM